ncbi:hypothetical protein KY290_030536 [Solanum tuberosum]|uniref:DCD domain-containing protein n=1 Tax=Solanum tuberosum TaxID=4113 RepID=A0ABQ7U737_SOLTU|nr:hypothetical protein KY290_030536 [Solanum tuberosum]
MEGIWEWKKTPVKLIWWNLLVATVEERSTGKSTWVKILGLPLHLWLQNFLKAIGYLCGGWLETEEETTLRNHLKWARIKEDLKRPLFGIPPRYRDSVREITPGLPLFLYNDTTHQLHGIFEASSFGGSNIDPTAWEDKKCKGESRFPAQVRIYCVPYIADDSSSDISAWVFFEAETNIPQRAEIVAKAGSTSNCNNF